MRPIEPIEIVLDRPRHLLLNLKALALAERELAKLLQQKKVSLLQVFQSGDVGIADLACLVWAGLLHEDSTLSLDQAMALIEMADMEMVAAKLSTAMHAHMGRRSAPADAGQEDQKSPDPTTATAPISTGSSSGASAGSSSG